jgi:hypothetical protein
LGRIISITEKLLRSPETCTLTSILCHAVDHVHVFDTGTFDSGAEVSTLVFDTHSRVTKVSARWMQVSMGNTWSTDKKWSLPRKVQHCLWVKYLPKNVDGSIVPPFILHSTVTYTYTYTQSTYTYIKTSNNYTRTKTHHAHTHTH